MQKYTVHKVPTIDKIDELVALNILPANFMENLSEKHLRDAHGSTPNNLIKNFKVIKKCRDKFECLVYEMLWIKNKRPKLNTQADSIRAKLFT